MKKVIYFIAPKNLEHIKNLGGVQFYRKLVGCDITIRGSPQLI